MEEEMVTVVSVCPVSGEYDYQSSLDYVFADPEEAMSFLKLSLSNGYTCLIYDKLKDK